MEINVGANLACRYFFAKNSNPAVKRENTAEAAGPANHDQGLIILKDNGSKDLLKIFGPAPIDIPSNHELVS